MINVGLGCSSSESQPGDGPTPTVFDPSPVTVADIARAWNPGETEVFITTMTSPYDEGLDPEEFRIHVSGGLVRMLRFESGELTQARLVDGDLNVIDAKPSGEVSRFRATSFEGTLPAGVALTYVIPAYSDLTDPRLAWEMVSSSPGQLVFRSERLPDQIGTLTVSATTLLPIHYSVTYSGWSLEFEFHDSELKPISNRDEVFSEEALLSLFAK